MIATPTGCCLSGTARCADTAQVPNPHQRAMAKLSHFDSSGQAHMVDVGAKTESGRVAVAEGWIRMQPATIEVV